MTPEDLTPDEWGRILEALDGPASPGAVGDAVARAFDVPEPRGFELVEAALEAGVLREQGTGGMFPEVRLAGREGSAGGDGAEDPTAGSPDAPNTAEHGGEGEPTPTRTPGETRRGPEDPPACGWGGARFDTAGSDIYPPELLELERWMGRVGKLPFAPWADAGARATCSMAEHDADTTAECECDARWKWGYTDNYTDGETVALAEDDPRLDGRVFLQTDTGPYAFVDGDDVRDPDTGEVHPAFVEILKQFGVSYADVSTSGSGVHVYYTGELPETFGSQTAFDLDGEPWGTNDSPPTVEIYTGKHVNVATGEHVPGSGLDVRPWDTEGLEDVLDEYAPTPEDPDPEQHDTDRDLELAGYDADATGHDDTTSDVRDVLAAVDRLRPADLPLDASNVGSDPTGWEKWDPSSYRSTEGNDSLHKPPDEAVFYDHKHGETFGVLGLYAAEQGIISYPWNRLAGAEWWEAVEAARDAGAPIPQYAGTRGARHDEDAEPAVVLPPGVRDLTTASSGLGTDRRHVETEGGLTLEAARGRTQDAIAEAYTYADTVLVEALPTTGKSRGAIEAAADTETAVTILTNRGPSEQYEQYRQWADDVGLKVYTLPSFPRECPTAAGEHGEDIQDTVRDWYNRGATPREIHKFAESELGDPLPCQRKGGCAYARKWDFDPDDYDVLLGHYAHGHKPKVTAGRAVVFDEFPGGAYEIEFDELLAPAVSHHLATTPELPFEDYTDLLERRQDPEPRARALEYYQDRELSPDELEVFDGDKTHAYAPLATYALVAGEDLGNGWEAANLGGQRRSVFNRSGGRLYLLNPPPLEPMRNLVALDGTPTRRMWELAIGAHMNRREVLTEAERRAYIRDVLGHKYVRTTEAVKPYNSAGHVNVERDAALLEAIAEQHGNRPAVISTMTAEREYARAGILELEDVPGVEGTSTDREPLARASAHHGDVKGSNRFKHDRLGSVLGSNHYGDGFIKKWGAYAGEGVERDGDGKGRGLAYTGIGDRILEHMREHDTLQAAMRFGRDGAGAVVYVHTDTLPEWVPIAAEARVLNTWSDGMRDVLEALEDIEAPTTAEILAHPSVEIGERGALKHLQDLADRGYLTPEQDPEDGRRVTWGNGEIHRVGEHGEVEIEAVEMEDLDEGEVHELGRTNIYTWEFVNRDAKPGVTAGTSGSEPAARAAEAVSPSIDEDPPPD